MIQSSKINNIQDVLEALQAHESLLTETEKRELDEKGFVLFYDMIDTNWIEDLRKRFDELIESEGAAAGKEVHQEKGTRRLADLVNKGEVFDRIYTHPKILAANYYIFKRDFRLNSLNGRDSVPGEGLQGLHSDWKERDLDEPYQVSNSIWLLDDFTEMNGATRMVPGTHHKKGLPKDYMEDTKAPHPDEILLIAPKGTVGVFNSHVWHGGTLNRSKGNRMALHCSFVGRDCEQQTNQKEYIRKSTYDRISESAKYLLDL
ncbi:phytanoyl-CoA dioxygenase family protein [Paenibacillus frigoriresistens]|uniref:phytanoyl-CoA dioxygenase family protein n=1 Tax=Paenibacillus alginolyticus TaxID=59839 RepID=UPI0015677ADB|nr:phytanoyl-CoA dioxygenase family protein [Paenibacillus frigoriresistens]NRF96328.1 phytanoyl-CoA dioxygenase family protein [Paenibacillus frigoriresistens]